MEGFLPYLFKSGICLVLFYICMRAFLSNETFFRFNRWVLLIGTTICLLLPLIRVKVDTPIVVQKPFMAVEELFMLSESQTTEIETVFLTDKKITEPLVSKKEKTSINIAFILLTAYLMGFIINLIILLRSLFLMLRLINKGNKLRYGRYMLVLISKDITPFSWGKYIVLSVTDFENYPDEIITHEAAHVKHHHSLDLIYFELLLLLQWFNPAIWLLKRELKDIHEYQADISVLRSGINATKYQLLLVKKAVGTSSYTLANSFNHSKIKKRITMMLREKSNKWARLKLLLLLPLGALTVFAFARPEVNEPLSSLVDYESTNILQKTKIAEEPITLNELKQKPSKEITSTKLQRDSLSKAVTDYIDKNGYKSEARIGVPSQGKFKIMSLSYTGDGDIKSTVFPESYSKKADPKDSDYLRIYWYVIDGKKYSWNKFMDKCRFGKVFLERNKIKPEDGNIMEMYGITTDGAKTPTFYMVGSVN